MFGRSNPDLTAIWNRFESQPDWEALLEMSFQQPVIIYKHSSRCGVCNASWQEVEKLSIEYSGRFHFYFVDVIAERSYSMAIAQQSGIRHESPQLILLANGEVQHNWTHWNIRFPEMEEAIDQIKAA
jgi:bacillithiol system protein YtxJ